jgi:nucleoside-diphosphate-sugar epimerase
LNREIAIIGAGGFVGSSLVESLILSGATRVRAVVRAYRSFAALSRFGDRVSLVRADAEVPDSIRPALAGCATVINLTTGSPDGIVQSTKVIYQACREAGVKKFIHVSSAVVFGDVASSSTVDDSPPLENHWMPYARAKAASENWLRRQARSPACQVIVLRPGIVWGVRSPHTIAIARALLERTAFLVDDGGGVFNAIYIDNLVECLRACDSYPGDASGFYNVADREFVTWRAFYNALGAQVGCDASRIPTVGGQRFPWSVPAAVEYVQALPVVDSVYHRLKRRLPDAWRARLKRLLARRAHGEETTSKRPLVSRELWHLQRTKHKLPADKFARRFGFTPPVSFEEGMARTGRWLAFVGYGRGAAAKAGQSS